MEAVVAIFSILVLVFSIIIGILENTKYSSKIEEVF
jgi:hypothetical protein